MPDGLVNSLIIVFFSNTDRMRCFDATAMPIFLCSISLVAQAILPRYRYDPLMRLGWKIFLPVILFLEKQ